jgi:hypothetical protein
MPKIDTFLLTSGPIFLLTSWSHATHITTPPCAAKLPAVTEYPDERKQWQLTEATSAMAFGLPGRLRASKGEGSELVEEKTDLHAKRNQNPLGHPHHLINQLLHINAPTPHD